MVAHDPNHGRQAPGRMIQEAAQGCGRFDRCIGWQRLPHRRQEKIEQHLDVVQMLLARQCHKNVSVKLSSTSFLCVHTLILRCKAVLDSFFVNRNISADILQLNVSPFSDRAPEQAHQR